MSMMKTVETTPERDIRTHKIGFGEIGDLVRALRELRRGRVKDAIRRIEDVLSDIDPRWPTLG